MTTWSAADQGQEGLGGAEGIDFKSWSNLPSSILTILLSQAELTVKCYLQIVIILQELLQFIFVLW